VSTPDDPEGFAADFAADFEDFGDAGIRRAYASQQEM
jgi:hypothetical protein